MNAGNELNDPFFTPLDPEEKREDGGVVSVPGQDKWFGCRVRREFLLQLVQSQASAKGQTQASIIQETLKDEVLALEPMVRDVLKVWIAIFPNGAPAKPGTRNEQIQNDYKRRGATPPSRRTIEKAAEVLKRAR